MLESAPFYSDIIGAGIEGQAQWLTTSDGVRIRVATWNEGSKNDKGTVLIFPGRSEYIEKYALAARDLQARGYASMAIDWRGQGLADRATGDPLIGHVDHFDDFQRDVDIMVETSKAQNLPKPFYLLGHSMGGAIGLRALFNGLPVIAAGFSAPMWGIGMTPAQKPLAWTLGPFLKAIGMGKSRTPMTSAETYVMTAPFDDNQLTTDRAMWDLMVHQAKTHPELTLGGPSISWLLGGMRECRDLARKSAPDMPTITFLGTNERIVNPASVNKRMAKWPESELITIEGAEHEIMMESTDTQSDMFDRLDRFYQAARR